MASKIEDPRFAQYAAFFERLTNDKTGSRELAKYVLGIQKKTRRELQEMQRLVEILQPAPSFLLFKGGKITTLGYSYHSADYETLTGAIMAFEEGYGDGSFVADSKNQVVLAESNTDVPVVTQFDRVVKAKEAMRLPEDHPAVRLSSLAHALIERTIQEGGPFECHLLMLAEGVNEKLEDLTY